MKTLFNRTKSLLFALAACIAFGALFVFEYSYFSEKFHQPNKYEQALREFQKLPQNSLDAVCVGSSHAYFSFSPAIFYENTGLYSYTYGSECQPYEVTYEFLKEIYKTQSPRIVFMEVFTAIPLQDNCHEDGCYVLAHYKLSGRESYNVLDYLPREKALSYYNEFINIHNDWRSRDLREIFSAKDTEPEEDDTFGYSFLEAPYQEPTSWWPPQEDTSQSVRPLLDKDRENLDKILALCKEHDARLVFYKTPLDGMDEANYAALKGVWEYAEEHNIPYADFLTLSKKLSLYSMRHYDGYHTNITGASVITSYLSDLIKKEDLSFEHQADSTLDNRLRKEAERELSALLNAERSSNVYLDVLSHMKDGYHVFAQKRRNGWYEEPSLRALKRMGFADVKKKESYYAVSKNGQLLKESEKEVTLFLEGKELRVNADGIWLNGEKIADLRVNTYLYLREDLTGYEAKKFRLSEGMDDGYNFYDYAR